MNFIQEFELLLKSKYPIIYINTSEEDRLEYIITQFITKKFNFNILYWDFVEGFSGNPNYNTLAIRNPSSALDIIKDLLGPYIIVLRDYNLFFSDNAILRKLRNLVVHLKNASVTLVITSCEIKVPIFLTEIITILKFPLPNEYEIKQEILKICSFSNQTYPIEILNNLVRVCKGLSLDRIRQVLCKVYVKYGCINNVCLDFILNEKKQVISETQILEFLENDLSLSDIGGLSELKNWLFLRSNSFSDQALLYGLPYPKGLLLTGVQGTGKSMIAKAIANDWQLPLLRLDIGKLFGGVIGESEFRIRRMIEITESLSPCILWIDEIDKGFGGIGTTNDSGTTSRVFATFITWLSEKTSPIFIIATANNIHYLPPELLRKGRFDEVFFIGLPSLQEREEIFQLHLSKVRSATWFSYDIKYLSKLCDSFSGAEIKQAIIDAMYIAFNEKRDFNTQDIIIAIKNIIPLGQSHKKELDSIQNWAATGRIRRAS
uniref:Uncharacterized AAA domain-containing protein ycf46 n=1 Tax=Compsopogon caeruleus TaxID=31354 RepID=A0A1Z1XB25_9RHOD|nr:ATPase AAA family [Compsopogon caeruleus]ARX95987.1 ATPase AAA family [Compsopogon caeruleus]